MEEETESGGFTRGMKTGILPTTWMHGKPRTIEVWTTVLPI